MRKKLITFNLIMILFVVLALTLMGYQVYKQSLLNSRMLYTTELQRQLSNSFDLKIKSVESDLDLLSKTDDVIDCLQQDIQSSAESKVVKEQKVRDLFYRFEEIHLDYLNMVLVYANGREYISNDSYRMVNESFNNETWFKEALNIENEYSYQFYNAVRNLHSWKGYDSQSYISMAKAVTFEGENIGVLLVDVSLKDLKELYKNLETGLGNFFFLMNNQGQIVLSPENSVVYRIRPSWFKDSEEGIIEAKILGNKYKLIYNRFENQKLLVVGVYDMTEEDAVLIPILENSLIMALIALTVATIWSIYFVSKQTKPIVKLTNLMQTASEGDLDIRFSESSSDEILTLGNSFNKMIVDIKDLLDLVYQEQQQKRNAELQVMQEQIKPHFLYNTLDLMSWKARKHDANDIVEIIEKMSDFFRISLSKGEELILLSEELKMVASYLDIQSLRYDNLFTYEINCPTEVETRLVPRMSLQPLVENCIYHGIKESDNATSVLKIVVEDLGNGILITVQDNGKGIKDDIMEKLNQSLATNNWEDWQGGFGVQNVGKRLWHTFETGSGLTYSKTSEGFTVVKLKIIYKNSAEDF